MEGYSVTEAASVLGVPTERVWELLARGVLSGAPEGDTGMRVFLQPRPAPRAAIEEPRAGNGNATTRPAEVESSPFRELLTEFRNLTERYGQALLALGESRGEVASLRSRVDLLEARIDLRLPMSGPMPQPGSQPQEWAPRGAAVEPATPGEVGRGMADVLEHAVDEPPRRKRTRGHRRATDEFAEALARADDPTPAELPGGAAAAAAFAALREERQHTVETDTDIGASLPRDLPAAESMATLEPEPMAAAEAEPAVAANLESVATEERFEAPEADLAPPAATFSEPVAMEQEVALQAEDQTAAAVTEPVSPIDAEPRAADALDEAAAIDDIESAAGSVVRFETPIEPEPAVEPALEAGPEPEPAADLEALPDVQSEPEAELMAAAWNMPAEDEGERVEDGLAPPDAEPMSDAGEFEGLSSLSTSVADEVEGAPSSDLESAGPPTDAADAAAVRAAPSDASPDEGSWDRLRYTTEIEEPDWIPEGPAPDGWSGQSVSDAQPDETAPVATDRIESEAFGWGQDETERWFASGRDEPSSTDEPIGDNQPLGDDQPLDDAEAPSEEATEPAEQARMEDPAEEMEVAGASGHTPPSQPSWESDQEGVEPAAPTPWAPAASPPPAWAERFPSTGTGSAPPPSAETGPASRAYRRLRRIFPG